MLKNLRIGFVTNLIIFIALGYASTHSVNPLRFWGCESLFIKVVLTFLAISLFLQLIAIYVISRIPEDANCSDPDCGKSIRTFYFIYRGGVMCPRCKRWYHGSCWERFNKIRYFDALKSHLGCKICEGAEPSKRRLFGEESIFGGDS